MDLPFFMENRRTIFFNVFTPHVLRLSMIFSVVLLVIMIVITNTAAKAHSDSDVEYKQESIFRGAGLSAKNNILADNMPTELGKVSISFEVDKITPTPTPAINPAEDSIWYQIADCESHINWKANTGNGYYGGLQFSLGAWASVGGQGNPADASAEEQISRGKLLQQRRGWGPWGGCSKKLGLI